MNGNFIEFSEGGFVIKILESKTEKEQAYRLRHKIFCRELKWISEKADGREIDSYDNNAILLGLFEKKLLVGIIRLIFSYMPMMIEKEFSELVSPLHRIKKDINTAELTRLGIKSDMRKSCKRRAALVMYKGIYFWSRWNDIRYLYLVVEKKMFRAFKVSGFPLKIVGPINRLKGGVESLAAILDWREFEKTSKLYPYFLKGNNLQFERLGHRMAAG